MEWMLSSWLRRRSRARGLAGETAYSTIGDGKSGRVFGSVWRARPWLLIALFAALAPWSHAQLSEDAAAALEARARAEAARAEAERAEAELAELELGSDEAEPTELVAAEGETQQQPELIEDIVDQTLRLVDLPASGNTPAHFAVAAALLLAAVALRKAIVVWIFRLLTKGAARTRGQLDDVALPVLESSARSLVLVLGIAAAFMVLKLPPAIEELLRWGYLIAVSLVLLVFFLRLTDALLAHLNNRARKRDLNVAVFMPWIRRIVLTTVFIFGVLTIAQSLGGDVRSFLAGLGIGGLAVALAAQDTLANIFGSVVVAVDQPFRVGETVQVGPHIGAVEDIGLRSTRLRTPQGNLVVIPNKTVASESIINLTRFARRRVEQTFRLAYESTPAQMAALVDEIRAIVLAEAEVDKPSVIAQFTEIGASSLDIWLAYNTLDPDFVKHLKLKQRINMAIVDAVAARGMRFAFPTQSVHVESWPETESRPPADDRAG